jgi:hypothetical protein
MAMTSFSDGSVLYASTLNNNFTYMTDRLKSYQQQSAVTGRYLSASVIIRINGTNIERSTNTGGAWSTVQASVPAGGTFNVNSNDPNYIVYYTSTWNAQAYYSTNAGVTWATITRPTDADGNYIAYSITDTGRICAIYDDTTNTEVAYTNNAGGAWTVVTALKMFLYFIVLVIVVLRMIIVVTV